MNALTVLTSEIRLHDGLYSLNDLHKASGNARKHQPYLFLRLDTTQALIAEIHSTETCSATKTINGGPNRGTYVCKELVYAYAMWISPKFHLAVIRAFDAMKADPAPSVRLPLVQGHDRWMVTRHHESGQEVYTAIPNDAFLMTPKQLMQVINDPGGAAVTDDDLWDLVEASLKRLRRRHAIRKALSEGGRR